MKSNILIFIPVEFVNAILILILIVQWTVLQSQANGDFLASAVSSIYIWLKKCKAAGNEMTAMKKLLVVFQSSGGGGGGKSAEATGLWSRAFMCVLQNLPPLTTVLLPHPAHPRKRFLLFILSFFFFFFTGCRPVTTSDQLVLLLIRSNRHTRKYRIYMHPHDPAPAPTIADKINIDLIWASPGKTGDGGGVKR